MSSTQAVLYLRVAVIVLSFNEPVMFPHCAVTSLTDMGLARPECLAYAEI